MRGWLGSTTWQKARFRTPRELRALVQQAGLSVTAVRGAVYYPPTDLLARLLAPLDPWLGRVTSIGAAFIALGAVNHEHMGGASSVGLGLRENWQQFSLLVLVNAFVGGMVTQRTVVPLIGSEEFKIASTTIIVSFIISSASSRPLPISSQDILPTSMAASILVLGWLIGLPVQFID